jgi:drug/metabolite transporter, DME family
MRLYFPIISIVGAAFLWGIIGLFVKSLYNAGFTSLEIVTLRVVFSSLLLILIGVFKNKSVFKIRLKDFYLFIGTGIASIVFFNWCYFTAMNMLSVSTAVILLYTSPVFVMIFSAIVFKERITIKKLTLVLFTIAGCGLIAGTNGVSTDPAGTIIGYLIGIGSGVGYALYSIFGKLALANYTSFTITLYTFLTASVFLLPITKIWTKSEDVFVLYNFGCIAGLALVSTVLAYLLYTWGLGRMEGSRAAVLATIEPVTAMVLGIFLFGERLTFIQLAGAIAILGSVAMYNLKPRDICNKMSTDIEVK